MTKPTRIKPAGLAERFRRCSRRAKQQPALSFDGETWSHTEMQQRIERLASVFAAGGARRGDRIGYLGFNHPTLLVGMFAAARLGAVFVPLNFRLYGPELKQILDDADLHTILVDAWHQPLIDELRASLGCQCYLRVDAGSLATPCESPWQSLPQLLDADTELAAAVDGSPDEPVLLIYTSGITGRPKGAMLSNENLWTNHQNGLPAGDFTSKDVTLVSAPLFHVGGLCGLLMPTLLAGGHVVLHRSFDAASVIRDVERYRVSIHFAVPAMMPFLHLHKAFASADLSSLKLTVAAGAPVPEPLLRLYVMCGVPASQRYGMTEATSDMRFLETDRTPARRDSRRRADMPGDVKLIDFKGQPITEADVPGEICIRGGNIISGYWRMPEAPAALYDAEGWFRTGSVASRKADGSYAIRDRLKDMIICGGENIYPGELESQLREHPAIAEVAVIGVPDERWGQRVVIVAVLKPAATLNIDELVRFLGGRLFVYKRPRNLHIVDAMPRDSNGNIVKMELLRLYAAASPAPPPLARKEKGKEKSGMSFDMANTASLAPLEPGIGEKRKRDITERAVTLEILDGIGQITLTQPERGNPFDQQFCSELCEVAIDCDENPAVRAILIRARGKYFSVGADLKWLGQDRALLPRHLKAATADLHMAVSRLARANAPVVIAIHALATGGSVSLTAMADFAIAARSAKFYAAFNAIGFVSDSGGTYYLPRRVGSRRAADFVMLNETWTAEQASSYGLVSRVVEDNDLEAEAFKLARLLAEGPTQTYGEMKRLFLSSHDQPLEAQLELEARAISRCARTYDSWNAIQSVLARQKPVFSGT